MNNIEKLNKAIPKIAEPRIPDLFSDTASAHAKGNAARWYAEMFIDLFLSQKARESTGDEAFRKLNLGDKIESIRSETGNRIIDALYQIKDFGDTASHYSPDTILTQAEAEKTVDVAIELITNVLVDEFKLTKMDSNYARARIFSVLFPGIREKVLSALIDKKAPLDNYNLELLHKYCLACTKNGKFNKARRILDDLLKKEAIPEAFHKFEIESMKSISSRIRKDELPIPKLMEDIARNFNEVLSSTTERDKTANERLIFILSTLIKDVFPSEMSGYVGDQVFIVSPD